MTTTNIKHISNYDDEKQCFTLFKMIDDSLNCGTSKAIPNGSTLWCVTASLSDFESYIGKYAAFQTKEGINAAGIVKNIDLVNSLIYYHC